MKRKLRTAAAARLTIGTAVARFWITRLGARSALGGDDESIIHCGLRKTRFECRHKEKTCIKEVLIIHQSDFERVLSSLFHVCVSSHHARNTRTYRGNS